MGVVFIAGRIVRSNLSIFTNELWWLYGNLIVNENKQLIVLPVGSVPRGIQTDSDPRVLNFYLYFFFDKILYFFDYWIFLVEVFVFLVKLQKFHRRSKFSDATAALFDNALNFRKILYPSERLPEKTLEQAPSVHLTR